MAKRFQQIEAPHRDFIGRQQIFFTASAAGQGHVNLSPRGADAFRIIDAARVMYLDRTGSGNETAAHLLADGRLTIMFCAFEGPPQILRLYGRGRMVNWADPEFAGLIEAHYDGEVPLGTRQLCLLDVSLVQTSCGYGVPLYAHQGPRASMENWHAAKGPEGLRAYWEENNLESLDGLPTGLLDR